MIQPFLDLWQTTPKRKGRANTHSRRENERTQTSSFMSHKPTSASAPPVARYLERNRQTARHKRDLRCRTLRAVVRHPPSLGVKLDAVAVARVRLRGSNMRRVNRRRTRTRRATHARTCSTCACLKVGNSMICTVPFPDRVPARGVRGAGPHECCWTSRSAAALFLLDPATTDKKQKARARRQQRTGREQEVLPAGVPGHLVHLAAGARG